MQRQDYYAPKYLNFSYQQYVERGKNFENLAIDNYLVDKVIGVGSFGSVYRGMDNLDKKEVAIKVMDMRAVHDQKVQKLKDIKLRLAETEPKLMQMCNSPCLLKCYDVYENEDLKVLILEYCKGKTLQNDIDLKGCIPESSAITIIKHIMIGLMELHKHNIVHRDLKAENIMQHNGTYKIIDFGFSKKLEISQEHAEVMGTALGTITTMAPEVMSRKAYGLKADIWSVGIIFFQMIYGIYPYDSVTALDMYRQIRNKKVLVKSTPESYNRITPSQQAYDFLKFLIVFQTDKRPNWKDVADHPFIKNSKQDALTRQFLCKRDVVVNQNLDCDKPIDEDKMVKVIEQLSLKIKKREIALKLDIEEEKKIIEQKKQKEQTNPAKKEEPVSKANKKQEPVSNPYKRQEPQVIEEKKPQIEKPAVEKSNLKRKIDLNQRMKEAEAQQKRIKQKEEQQERVRLRQEEQRRKRIAAEQLKQQLAAANRKKLEEHKERTRVMEEEKRRNSTNRANPIRPIVISAEQSMKKRRQIQSREGDQVSKTRLIHLECLKTEWIFSRIVEPIIDHKSLDINQREVIEFLYLLLARCFNNMSPLEDELSKGQGKNQFMINLKDQVKQLYSKVRDRFLDYSAKLTKVEDKAGSIVLDFFSRNIFDKSRYNEKNKFLTGIQNIEYSKQEQINYTSFFFKEKIGKMMAKLSHTESKLLLFLNNYNQINDITQQRIEKQKRDFDTIKNEILMK